MASYDFNEALVVIDLQNPDTCRKAFEKVIEHYSEPLYWHIRKMVVNHDDANDILQNTFLKAWNSIEYFRGDAKISTWLYKIAINESLTFIEREKKRRNITVEDDDSFLLDNLQADEYFDGNELQKDLQKAVNQLSEKQRLVFNMRYFDDMKYDQISDILGTSVGALKASYHHAVKKIEQFFKQ